MMKIHVFKYYILTNYIKVMVYNAVNNGGIITDELLDEVVLIPYASRVTTSPNGTTPDDIASFGILVDNISILNVQKYRLNEGVNAENSFYKGLVLTAFDDMLNEIISLTGFTDVVKGGGGSADDRVPYIGAISDVDLGEFQVKTGQVELDATPTQPFGERKMRWNDTDGTLDVGLKGGNVTLQVGQEQVIRVVNKTGITLNEADYKVVRFRLVSEGGAQGQRMAVVLAQADADVNSVTTIGVVTETIANNQEGFITTSGEVRNINTTGALQGETWADGDIVYLSPITAGGLTNIKPIAPQHTVQVGYVSYTHAVNGKVFVHVQNGYELEELHDVTETNYTTPQDEDSILTFDGTQLLWKRLTLQNAMNYFKTALSAFFQSKAYIYRLFTQSIGSNTTGETQLLQIIIPANTFKPTDKLAFFATFSKNGVASNVTHRIKVSTSASMPVGSASQIAQYASINTALFTKINRELTISGGILKGYPFIPSAVSDSGISTTAMSSVAFDVTITQYLYVSATPSGVTTDTAYLEAFEIRNI